MSGDQAAWISCYEKVIDAAMVGSCTLAGAEIAHTGLHGAGHSVRRYFDTGRLLRVCMAWQTNEVWQE